MTGFVESVAIPGLSNPTVVRFAKDGRVFVAEKAGRVLVYSNLADPEPTVFADLSANVHDFWDRGMLGMALHPNFPATPYVYVLYTYDAPPGGTAPTWGDSCPTPPGATDDGCVVSGRLSRLTASGDVMSEEQVLVSGWGQQYPSHATGDLQFGPDGYLYASGGDGSSFNFVDYGQEGNPVNPLGDPPVPVGQAQTPPSALGGSLRSQSLRRPSGPVLLNGTVIRVDPVTGAAAPGNPLGGSADLNARRIVASGLRNPFRIRPNPANGELFIGDVGWGSWEEINRVPSGAGFSPNFGWPCYEGAGKQQSYESTGFSACDELYAAGEHVPPFYAYFHGAAVGNGDQCSLAGGGSSISGLAIYPGGAYPDEFDGALFFSDYSRRCIWVMSRGGSGDLDPGTVKNFIVDAESPVYLEPGPNGDLYYAELRGDGQGAIRHVGYLAPVAVASVTPTKGKAPLLVNYDGSQSIEPLPSDTLTYAWDLDGDGAFDDSSTAQGSFQYDTAGTYSVRLRVTDPRGSSDESDPLAIEVTLKEPPSDEPPKVHIDSPSASKTWEAGETISFTGHATDKEDGPLKASALHWSVIVQHCPDDGCHAHPLQSFVGVAEGSFSAVDHEFPMYLELVLSATDSDGNQSIVSRELHPAAYSVTLDTQPTGLRLGLNGTVAKTPFVRQVVAGSNNTVVADALQVRDGVSYAFVSWSDGLAASHQVGPVLGPLSRTAEYRPAGLTAQYFEGTELEGTPLLRIDPMVDFDWGDGSFAEGYATDSFSARWTGYVQPEFSEEYEFCVASDEGVRLWIDDLKEPLVDDWKGHSERESCAARPLTAEQRHTVRLEYYEGSGNAVVRFAWSSASQAKEIVPATRLLPGCSEGGASECPEGLSCRGGLCETPCDPATCESGEHCSGGSCKPICDSIECPDDEPCVDGVCGGAKEPHGDAGAGGDDASSPGGAGAGGSGARPATGGAPSGGSGGDGGAGAGDKQSRADAGDGCACRAGPRRTGGGAPWLVVALGALFLGFRTSSACRRRAVRRSGRSGAEQRSGRASSRS